VAAHGGFATPCNSELLRVIAPCPAPPQTHTSPCPTDLFRLKVSAFSEPWAAPGKSILLAIFPSLWLKQYFKVILAIAKGVPSFFIRYQRIVLYEIIYFNCGFRAK
jgi:hypothetical protein